MVTSATTTARSLADLAAGSSDTALGVCLSVNSSTLLATIDLGGSTVAVPWIGPQPYLGDRVRLVSAGQKPFCVAQYGHPLGTVVSVGSNLATATGDDGKTYVYPYPNGLTLAGGNRVAMDHALRVVVERISTEPPGSTYVPQGGAPSSGGQSATFHPTDSGNYSGGKYMSQYAEISVSRSAFYWYGTQIADTIPDTATPTKAVVRLSEVWDEVPGAASVMQLHTDSSAAHGGSLPTLTGSGINVSGSGEVDILSFASSLKTGSAFGLGFPLNHGWRRFDTFLASGDIYIEWTP